VGCSARALQGHAGGRPGDLRYAVTFGYATFYIEHTLHRELTGLLAALLMVGRRRRGSVWAWHGGRKDGSVAGLDCHKRQLDLEALVTLRFTARAEMDGRGVFGRL